MLQHLAHDGCVRGGQRVGCDVAAHKTYSLSPKGPSVGIDNHLGDINAYVARHQFGNQLSGLEISAAEIS